MRCTKVDHESRVTQTFYDVPLQVRNNDNSKFEKKTSINDRQLIVRALFFYYQVTDSFRDFCKSEILTGDNLYDAGSIHGLQVFVSML